MKKIGFLLSLALCFSLCTAAVFAAEKQTPANKKQEQVQAQEQKVFVTKTGKRFHANASCPTLKKSKDIKQVSMKDAAAQKLTPCKTCYPNKK